MGFNAADHKESDDRDFSVPMDKGIFTVMLVKSEKKESQKQGNFYLNTQFKVVNNDNEKYNGRIIFNIFNLKNSNETAQTISEGQFSSFMLGCGVPTINDKWAPDELYNLPVQVRVGIQKSEGYDDKNNIERFLKVDATAGEEDGGSPFGDDEPETKKKKKKGKKGKKNKKNKGSEETPF